MNAPRVGEWILTGGPGERGVARGDHVAVGAGAVASWGRSARFEFSGFAPSTATWGKSWING